MAAITKESTIGEVLARDMQAAKYTVKKQKCPDFSIGATQKDSHGEPKISIFPPNLRVRRTCTSTYKWVDALEVDAGMP
ncbi:MAG: hypothetical protein HFH26_13760 [Clostridiaceae bacterium]|nr:hypothetical protein [Clostridiaceae bacterium]